MTVLRRNLAKIPSSVDFSGWNGVGWGTGGAGVQGSVTDVGYLGLAAYQMQFTASPTGGGAGIRVGGFNGGVPGPTMTAATPGIAYTGSVYFESNGAEGAFLARIRWYGPTGTTLSTADGVPTAVPADTPTRLSVTGTAPAGAVAMTVEVRTNAAAGTPTGRRWRASAPLIEEGSTLGSFFYGETPDPAGFNHGWEGTPNKSVSYYESVDVAPETGQVATAASFNPAQTALSVGLIRAGGSAVTAVLYDGAAELERNPVLVDVFGWGNATFSGLTADTQYVVRFEVDGVLQTDVTLQVKTLPTGGASFVVVAGSCQATGSNHPVFERMAAAGPAFLTHMGDLHYQDAESEMNWRLGHKISLGSTAMRAMLQTVPMTWTADNHDRIVTNPGGAGLPSNYGATDPATVTSWKQLAGGSGWAAADTLGRTWVSGRVRFIQTDHWSVRDDGDFVEEPRSFLGAAQKTWWKTTLEASTEPLIVWFTSWTMANNGNGRWNTYPTETAELEAWLDARPGIKSRMVLVGGDSHSVQADDGSRGGTLRFKGIPSYNVSGFNQSNDDPAGDTLPHWNIINTSIRSPEQPAADWGAFSRLTFTDSDASGIAFQWEAVRVGPTGTEDVMASHALTFGAAPTFRLVEIVGASETPLTPVEVAGSTEVLLEVVESAT